MRGIIKTENHKPRSNKKACDTGGLSEDKNLGIDVVSKNHFIIIIETILHPFLEECRNMSSQMEIVVRQVLGKTLLTTYCLFLMILMSVLDFYWKTECGLNFR